MVNPSPVPRAAPACRAAGQSASVRALQRVRPADARLAPVAVVPEIRLHQADEPIGLWELTEGEFRSDQPPPFWAFAWAGGQALARYVLDHPEMVAGRRVLDLASGSGLVAIAAARAGAAPVARRRDRPAGGRGGRAQRRGQRGDASTPSSATSSTATPGTPRWCSPATSSTAEAMARRVLAFLLRAARGGARALVGDPGRAYLPRDRFRRAGRLRRAGAAGAGERPGEAHHGLGAVAPRPGCRGPPG